MIKIVVAGDYCPQARVMDLFASRDYSAVFKEVTEELRRVDYSIINLECPVANSNDVPIEKCGQNLRCGEEGIEALSMAGFNCVTLANNHFFDFGQTGVIKTIDTCKKYHIDIVGGGESLEISSQILYKKINNKKIAIINCCEHEFSIATESSGGSNPLNPVSQYYKIREGRTNADYVIVIIHGGNEYYQLPSPRMKELYRFFIDVGADCVINHHQHCYSGYEVYKEKPIFYGIGNFCFDDPQMKEVTWHEGYMVELLLDAEKMSFQLHPYSQCEETPGIYFMSAERKLRFEAKIQELNSIIQDDDLLKREYDAFLEKNTDDVRLLFMPVVNRIMNALGRRHLLPRFISRKNKYKIMDFLMCESHQPKVIKYIQQI